MDGLFKEFSNENEYLTKPRKWKKFLRAAALAQQMNADANLSAQISSTKMSNTSKNCNDSGIILSESLLCNYQQNHQQQHQQQCDVLENSQRTSVLELTFVSEDGIESKRKTNRFFTPNAIEILKRWFNSNLDYPYPDDNTTNELANEANISTKQVRKWFANKRVRSNKCYKQIYRSKKRPDGETKDDDESSDESDYKTDTSKDVSSTSLSVSPYSSSSYESNEISLSNTTISSTSDESVQDFNHRYQHSTPIMIPSQYAQPQIKTNLNHVAAAAAAAIYNPLILMNYIKNPLMMHAALQQQQQLHHSQRVDSLSHMITLQDNHNQQLHQQPIQRPQQQPRMKINFGNISELIY